jgi:hypothetical protein
VPEARDCGLAMLCFLRDGLMLLDLVFSFWLKTGLVLLWMFWSAGVLMFFCIELVAWFLLEGRSRLFNLPLSKNAIVYIIYVYIVRFIYITLQTSWAPSSEPVSTSSFFTVPWMQRINASRSSRTLLAKSASDFTILVFTDSFCNSRFHLASGPFRCSSPPPDFWTGTGQPHGRHLSRVYWFRTSALLVSSIRSRFLTCTPVLSPPPPAARRSPRPRRFSIAGSKLRTGVHVFFFLPFLGCRESTPPVPPVHF